MTPVRALAALLIACALSGCKTQLALTADAIGCGVTQVDVLDSRYSRSGSTTAWCAKCKGKTYQCASNPDRSRVECREAAPDACE